MSVSPANKKGRLWEASKGGTRVARSLSVSKSEIMATSWSTFYFGNNIYYDIIL